MRSWATVVCAIRIEAWVIAESTIAYQFTPVLDHQAKLTSKRIIRKPGMQAVTMGAHHVEKQIGVARIALATAWVKGLSVFGQ